MSPGLARSQRAFTTALFDPVAAAPAVLRDAASVRAASAFAVYRNNIAGGLINVLTARFPVIVRLIGEDAFRGLALRFIALYPPRSAGADELWRRLSGLSAVPDRDLDGGLSCRHRAARGGAGSCLPRGRREAGRARAFRRTDG